MSDSLLTICAECGQVEEYDELIPCELRGEPARVCLRCIARFMKWVQPPEREAES